MILASALVVVWLAASGSTRIGLRPDHTAATSQTDVVDLMSNAKDLPIDSTMPYY